METTLFGRAKKAWNVFRNKDPSYKNTNGYYHNGTSDRPDKLKSYYNSQKRMTASIYSRIANDVASLDFKHVELDEKGNYKKSLRFTPLNEIMSLQANVDQTGRQFIRDIVISMCDEGHVAVVPIDTDDDPEDKMGGFDIFSARVCQIIEWLPRHVRVNAYDDTTGLMEELLVDKASCAIIENPFYTVMNEPNSTLKRLTNKLELLDIADEKNITGKLDIIIQLPYTIRTQKKRDEAEKRRKEVESQMADSRYGIAYIDAAEKVTQLNRAAENQLIPQIDKLQLMLHNELGLTNGIIDGTAKEEEILNYFSRTIEAFANAIRDEFVRKFLTRTARSQGQSIKYFRDMFKLTPIKEVAELADKLIRNEILSPNEFRGILSFEPNPNPKSDELRNPNLNAKDQVLSEDNPEVQNGSNLKETDGKEKE